MLSKATTILAGVFMVTCLALSMLRPSSSSVLDKAGAAAPAAPAPVPAARRFGARRIGPGRFGPRRPPIRPGGAGARRVPVPRSS